MPADGRGRFSAIFPELGDLQCERVRSTIKESFVEAGWPGSDRAEPKFKRFVEILRKDMFRRGIQDRITHALIFDEAHRAAGLKLIPAMAKECRKYGISLVLASQEARDFHPSVFSAIANYLVLRLTDTDAKALVRNVATAQQERMLIDWIKQMDRFNSPWWNPRVAPRAVRRPPDKA